MLLISSSVLVLVRVGSCFVLLFHSKKMFVISSFRQVALTFTNSDSDKCFCVEMCLASPACSVRQSRIRGLPHTHTHTHTVVTHTHTHITHHHLVFVAGGIIITAFRCILSWRVDHILLAYSTKSMSDMLDASNIRRNPSTYVVLFRERHR